MPGRERTGRERGGYCAARRRSAKGSRRVECSSGRHTDCRLGEGGLWLCGEGAGHRRRSDEARPRAAGGETARAAQKPRGAGCGGLAGLGNSACFCALSIYR